MRTATVVTLALTSFFCAFAIAWLLDLFCLAHFFKEIHYGQTNLPLWLNALISPGQSPWLIIISLLIGVKILKIVSPHPNFWSRFVVVTTLLTLAVRYLLWRSFATLNLANPLDGVFSISLFIMEVFVIFNYIIQLFLMLREKNRSREADRHSIAINSGEFCPSVDILIPTYNEPDFILRRTIIGCQAIEYKNKKIYVLDDGKRSEIKELTRELGCGYITRPNNKHAKAGNLNNGIARTNGEIIVCFDADFVPTKNFLERTLGFFINAKMGLIQTHQYFYNTDLISRNLGIEEHLTHEVEMFSRHYQLLRDGAESSLCYGSSFLVRRSALEEIGGFVTETLSEDYFTGIRLSDRGYDVIYLDENLSAGLVAEDLAGHIAQRQRWTRGTLQAFFVDANPLTLPGLSLRQKIAHFEGILQWFTSLCRVGFLLIPFAYYFLGVIPIKMTLSGWLYFFLPYYLVQLSTFSWLNHRSRSALISDVYAVIQCFPVSLTIIQTMLDPFSQGFKVTPKGITSDKFSLNWMLAFPLIVVLLGTIVGVGWSLFQFDWQSTDWLLIGVAWSAYNILTLTIALLSLIDIPQTDSSAWFELHREVTLCAGKHTYFGTIQTISETGATVKLSAANLPKIPQNGTAIILEIIPENLKLHGISTHIDNCTLQIAFKEVTLEQQRCLIEMLFCHPGQWIRQETPGEFRLFGLLLKSLLQPRILTKNTKVSAMRVVQSSGVRAKNYDFKASRDRALPITR
ncbi:glycosyltransferase [Lusitaniella coriacea]|uniref:glycosyltransferase family 2 protein n=1 Tax=Lusitaniella coriacea TaxID=1983105 RepID=UPI003CF6ED81